MLGYEYALSSAGIFVGHDILGAFYQENHEKPKEAVLAAGRQFFQPYVNMMRPIVGYSGSPPQGTLNDRAGFSCTDQRQTGQLGNNRASKMSLITMTCPDPVRAARFAFLAMQPVGHAVLAILVIWRFA
jgi:hypothetical protein